MINRIALFLFFQAISSQVFAHCQIDTAQIVLNLMKERTHHMRNVAATKFIHQKNLYDAQQEKTVLQNSKTMATQFKLPEGKLLIFIQIQMDFSKQIQAYWTHYWQLNPNDVPKKDELYTLEELRKKISEIDSQLLPKITDFANSTTCQAKELRPLFQQTLLKAYESAHLEPWIDMLLEALVILRHH